MSRLLCHCEECGTPHIYDTSIHTVEENTSYSDNNWDYDSNDIIPLKTALLFDRQSYQCIMCGTENVLEVYENKTYGVS